MSEFINAVEFQYKLYKHYKGKYYLVHGVCEHTENNEQLIIYRPLYGEHGLFVRPISMFNDYIDDDQRFTFIADLSDADKLHSRCLMMASYAHKNQIRKYSGLPYINHPISVAMRIKALYPDAHVAIAAAFLHDTLEDTDLSYNNISEINNEVAKVVLEVTDDQRTNKRKQKENQIISSYKKSIAARMVKTADKIDNCTDFAKQISGEPLLGVMCFSLKVIDQMRCAEIELLTQEFDKLFNNVVPKDTDIDHCTQLYLNGKQ